MLSSLPPAPALLRVRSGGRARLALWDGAHLVDLAAAADRRLGSLDALCALGREGARALLEGPDVRGLPELDPAELDWAAPAEAQEVWAAGVTYLRSRRARVEESAHRDVYALAYEAERPELFFKAAGWRVVPHGGRVGIRPDSHWDVPEPELAVLSGADASILGYACGNDMSSRSIEAANPLYLPQAKTYADSCSIGPAAVLGWHVDPRRAAVRLRIERGGELAFEGAGSVADLVRELSDLVGVLHSAYPLPAGAWLLTGTSIVPHDAYSAAAGDVIRITIDGVGELVNTVYLVEHSGATAPAHLPEV